MKTLNIEVANALIEYAILNACELLDHCGIQDATLTEIVLIADKVDLASRQFSALSEDAQRELCALLGLDYD